MSKRIFCIFCSMVLLAGMAAVTGILPTAAQVTVTQLGDGDDARLIAPADNILTKATAAVTDKTGTTAANKNNWNVLFDGNVAGVNCTNDDANIAVISGARWAEGQPFSSMYFSFTFTGHYVFDSLLLGGDNDTAYGIINPRVYIGDESITEVIANGTQPVWSYSGVVGAGMLVDLSQETLMGTTLIIQSDTKGSGSWTYVHASELAATGTPSIITTELGDGDDARLIAPADNILTKATAAVTDKTGITAANKNNWDVLFDGNVAGVNCTNDDANVAIINGERWAEGQPFSSMYFSFTFTGHYVFDSLLLGGDNDTAYGIINPRVYIGDESITEVIANGTQPVWSYSGVVGAGMLVDLSQETLMGTTLIIQSDTKGSGSWTYVHASELAATGASMIRTTELGEGDEDKLIAPADNILAKATAAVTDKTGTTAANKNNWGVLFDGNVAGVNCTNDNANVAIINGERWAEGQPFSSMYFSFTFSEEYAMETLLLGGYNDTAYGIINPQVYFGNESIAEVIANGTQPVWSYSGVVSAGMLVDFSEEKLTGTTLIVKSDTKGSGSWTYVHASELAVTGRTTAVKTRQETIVCVGDSITHGTVFNNVDTWSASQLENHYPLQLERLLDAASRTVDYTVINAGIGGSAVIGASEGYSTSNSSGGPTHWLTEQESYGYVQSADKVLIMLGTNDAHSSCWSGRANDYKTYYKQIVDAFRAENPGVEIYILTSPYTDVSTHADNLANGVVPQQKELSQELGVPLIDVYGATKQFVADHDGDLSCFIDAVDIAKGLCVHPHEAGAAVIAQTVFEGLTVPVRSLGAQLRGGYDPAASTADLRFCFELDARNLSADEQHTAQIAADSAVTVGDSAYRVVGMGALVARGDKVTKEDMTLEQADSLTALANVSAVKLYSAGDYMVSYTAVVTSIPAGHFGTELLARPYVIYEKDGVESVAYGQVIARSVSGVAGTAD